MAHDLLSQSSTSAAQFSELCNAMYERELQVLAHAEFSSVKQVQSKLQSLSHYIKRTAGSMLGAQSPLALDSQNASWAMKQAKQLPIKEQTTDDIRKWYATNKLALGLVVPVLVRSGVSSRIMIDCIDKIDHDKQRFRTNYCGWFNYNETVMNKNQSFTLLKPSKKVLSAACSGHQWQGESKTQPLTLPLRELLLSCQINWHNLRTPVPAKAAFI